MLSETRRIILQTRKQNIFQVIQKIIIKMNSNNMQVLLLFNFGYYENLNF